MDKKMVSLEGLRAAFIVVAQNTVSMEQVNSAIQNALQSIKETKSQTGGVS